MKEKCRNCEHLIVTHVNDDFSRGSGYCKRFTNAAGWYRGEINHTVFSSERNRYCGFEPRTSTLEVGKGTE